MRIQSWLAVVVTGAALVSTGFSASPLEVNASDRVGRLISQLGSERYSEREAAAVALDAIGQPALAALRQARQSEDPEVSRRAKLLVSRIEKRIETNQLLAPKRLRLEFRDMPVNAAVEQFAKQTGFTISLQGDISKVANRKITLDTGEVPFWEAFTQFCQAAGLSERGPNSTLPPNSTSKDDPNQIIVKQVILRHRAYGTQAPIDNRLLLNDGKPPLLPACNTNAIRIRALPANASVKTAGETGFILDATPEPSMMCHGIVDVRIDQAIDDQGQVLSQAPTWGGVHAQAFGDVIIVNGVMFVDGEDGSNSQQMAIRFRADQKPSKFLKEVRGTLATKIQTAPQPVLTVENVLQSAGRSVHSDEAGSLKVHEATLLNNGTIRLRIRLETLGLSPQNGVARVFRVNGQRIMRGNRGVQELPGGNGSELALLDAKDQSFPIVSNSNTQTDFNGNGMVAQEFDLIYKAQAGLGEPAKLVLRNRRTVAVEFPFTLKNVPLP